MPIRLSRTGFEDFLSLNRIGTKNGVIHPSPTQNTPTANLGVFKMTSLKEVNYAIGVSQVVATDIMFRTCPS